MNFQPITLAQWRALVDKELEGKPFDKVLVQQTPEGIPVLPLYTETPVKGAVREVTASPLRICIRHTGSVNQQALSEDAEGGADAFWLPLRAVPDALFARSNLSFVFDVESVAEVEALLAKRRGDFALNVRDSGLWGAVAKLVDAARVTDATSVMVSTLPFHDAGADSADEIAFALSTGVQVIETLQATGLTVDAAARQIALQVAVGRDTFVELCKLRAFRTVWRKVLAGFGVSAAVSRTRIHAVCSARTLAARDPWVNMLRVTTQMFSAVLGGADLVTPNAFDQVLGEPSALGRRVARNTGLILRDESGLGRVADAAGGSYFFETYTDELARESWKRFQALEKTGGIAAAQKDGSLAARIEKSWHQRLAQLATRKIPVLGVSEFANLDEVIQKPNSVQLEPPRGVSKTGSTEPNPPSTTRRDSAAFELLRDRADSVNPRPEAILVTLGTLADSRARAGFASGFFAAGGIRSHESTATEKSPIACLCGTDVQYAIEAADRARALKSAGCTRVLLAGRPGPLEATLREAGVDGFIFAGCDTVATLSDLLGLPS